MVPYHTGTATTILRYGTIQPSFSHIISPFYFILYMTDDTTYDTVFQTVAQNTLILRVHFPPHGCPVMTLAGCTATHPWIDAQMRVTGYKPIQSDQHWRDAHMLSGVAVQEVVQHFQVQPPTIQQITDAGLRNIQPRPQNGSTTTAARPHNQHRTSPAAASDDAPPDYETLLQQTQSPPTPPPPSVDIPSVPTEFSKLQGMEREELERLLKDHVALVAFCHDLPYTKELHEKRVAVVEETVAKAEKNREKEASLRQLHTQVQDLQTQLNARVEAFQKLEAQQDSLCAVPDTHLILQELHGAKKKTFDESEQMAEEWLDDGADNVRDFCRRFIEARKTHHVLAGKMEVLQRQNQESL